VEEQRTLTDHQLVDLMDLIAQTYQRDLRQALADPEYLGNCDAFFLALQARSPEVASGYVMHLSQINKATFDPSRLKHWDALNRHCHEAVLRADDPCELRRRAEFLIDCVRINRSHGRQAALLFKLSDGNMDPRRS